MIHAGVGETYLNVLTFLDMSHVHHKTLKKVEHGVSSALEKCARRSCSTFLQDEHALTLKSTASSAVPTSSVSTSPVSAAVSMSLISSSPPASPQPQLAPSSQAANLNLSPNKLLR